METSLHRQLKEHFAEEGAELEVRLGRYRIDVVNGSQLVEIQHGSLSAIRDKVRVLLEEHDVTVVKPIIAKKTLIKTSKRGGQEVSRRRSPKKGQLLHLFEELVYFTSVFPHDRLTLLVPLVEVEEWRYPGHGRRRRWRKGDFQVEDQRLVRVVKTHAFQTAADLCRLLPPRLKQPFHTGQLAHKLDIDRALAQRIAYCLREIEAIRTVGKQGQAWLYEKSLTKKAA